MSTESCLLYAALVLLLVMVFYYFYYFYDKHQCKKAKLYSAVAAQAANEQIANAQNAIMQASTMPANLQQYIPKECTTLQQSLMSARSMTPAQLTQLNKIDGLDTCVDYVTGLDPKTVFGYIKNQYKTPVPICVNPAVLKQVQGATSKLGNFAFDVMGQAPACT